MENLSDLKDKVDSLFNFQDTQKSLTIEQQLSGLQELKNEIVSIDKKEIKTIEDKSFIQDYLKILCKVSVEAVENFSKNIKIGSPANYGENLATLITSTTNLLKELREFGKMIHDLEMLHDPNIMQPIQETQKSMIMSGKELAVFMKEIQNSNSLNEIKAEFKIVEEGIFKEVLKNEVTEKETQEISKEIPELSATPRS